VRDYETGKWGRAHMISVSSAESVPSGRLGRVIFEDPALDFANTHLYIGPDIKDPQNPIGAGPTMAGGVIMALASIQDNRPYFDSESGPIDHWIVDVDFDKEYHHNMSWGHLIAGGAGSGMRWPYSDPHWILPDLRDNLLGLARFASTVDWAHFTSRNINGQIKLSTRGVISTGCSDGQTALIWLLLDTRQRDAGMIPGVEMTVEDVLADGGYTVEFWETYEGNLIGTAEATVADGDLSLTIPDLGVPLKDLALIIRPDAS
jgi:mannan endo-1,4-beta-mannosidase